MNNNITTSIHYLNNEYKITFSENVKLGSIQEEILKKCMLIIYNIEHTKVFISNKEFILGDSSNSPFSLKWIDFLKMNDIKEDEKIDRFEVYDRRRDERGNVIKDNEIINNFQKYVQDEESEIFLRSFNNESDNLRSNTNGMLNLFNIFNEALNESNNIGNIPILNFDEALTPLLNSTILTEVNTLSNNIQVVSSIINEEIDEEEEDEEKVESNEPSESIRLNHTINDEVNEIRNIINIIGRHERYGSTMNIIRDLVNSTSELNQTTPSNEVNEVDEPEESIESDSEFEDEETKEEINIPLRRTLNTGFNSNRLNLATNNITIRNVNRLNDLIFTPFLGNTPIINFANLGTFGNLRDIKVNLTDEEFNSLERKPYKDMSKLENITECTICTDSFKDDDEVVKTPCEHIFHLNCIKPWLCNESNKCPVCRKEVAKGRPDIDTNDTHSTLDDIE